MMFEMKMYDYEKIMILSVLRRIFFSKSLPGDEWSISEPVLSSSHEEFRIYYKNSLIACLLRSHDQSSSILYKVGGIKNHPLFNERCEAIKILCDICGCRFDHSLAAEAFQ